MTTLKEKLQQSRTQAEQPNHVLIIARAGTGKTSTLVEGLKLMLGHQAAFTPSSQQQDIWDQLMLSQATAKSICFAAFNNSIFKELEKRVPKGTEAATIHRLGNRAVFRAYGKLELNNKRTELLLSKLVKVPIKELKDKYPEQVQAVSHLVGLCKVNLYDGTVDELDELCHVHDIDTNHSREKIYKHVPRILEMAKSPRQDMMMDFNDMIWLPIVNNLGIRKYDLLLVDEAQDLNRCQQELALRMGRRIVFCGDDKQAIYGFAGADSKSLLSLKEKLGDPVVLPLNVTRRCGKAIVAEAQNLVPDFYAHESNCEGKVSSRAIEGVPFTTYCPSEPSTGGVQLHQTGYRYYAEAGDMVICRTNAPLVEQCFKFIKMGKKANIMGRDIGKNLIKLIERFKTNDIPELMSRLEEWYRLEVQKENAKSNPNERKLQNLSDRYECVQVLCEDKKNVKEVVANIKSIFSDNVEDGITLSSGHKAKGLEAKRVFFLQPEGAGIPHPMAKTAVALEQEYNLKYVVLTRAIEELVYVS